MNLLFYRVYIMIRRRDMSDFIYGGMDGVITTSAIIAGIIGANISTKYALVLGLANLCADGFSMGISRYNSLVDMNFSTKYPLYASIITFLSFVVMGAIPFIPFLFISFDNDILLKQMLFVCSFVAFILIGVIKGFFTKKYLKSIGEVVIIGSIGIYISFRVSRYVKTQL